ncbi:hypothetical protein M514_24608 [Trichuris suis]|uniref:Uncharacterized protein n=1 Tax=Trichuris suis TaxID=68888 RepID=A0A085N184_9BILA|nr:hypothetical protein M514_24608 [Trichuris suis]
MAEQVCRQSYSMTVGRVTEKAEPRSITKQYISWRMQYVALDQVKLNSPKLNSKSSSDNISNSTSSVSNPRIHEIRFLVELRYRSGTPRLMLLGLCP